MKFYFVDKGLKVLDQQSILDRISVGVASDIVIAFVQNLLEGKHVDPRLTAYVLETFKEELETEND